jgi:hypothetical protein
MRIENWHLSGHVVGLYDPPETQRLQISGQVFGSPNPRFPDGKRITTSDLVSVEGRDVTTRSGSVYTLGKVSEEYMEWCEKEGCHVPTWDEPIKLL